jgi:hypothetical protein
VPLGKVEVARLFAATKPGSAKNCNKISAISDGSLRRPITSLIDVIGNHVPLFRIAIQAVVDISL